MQNPYTLVFGQPPLEMIERTAQAERIISEFSQERPVNSINLITGVRGCGKTVFVTQIADRLREKEWIIINLNEQRDLLRSFAAKLNSDRRLNHQAIMKKYMETLQIRQDEAIRLAQATKGYAFAFQTIGYFYWENPLDSQKAMDNAMDYLSEFAYRKIWTELSRKDKEVVLAISKVKTGEIMQIREILRYSTNQFNPYRDRLIKAGIVHSSQNGVIEFSLPGFGEFAQMMSTQMGSPPPL